VRDVRLSWDPVKEPFFTHGLEVNNFDGLTVGSFEGTAAPNNTHAYPVVVRNGTGCKISMPKASVLRENVKEVRGK
jgi:hypothetical protein